jgi:hypothetical protein
MTSAKTSRGWTISALLAMRAGMRAKLERLPPASPGHAALAALYDKTTGEVDDRARRA